MTIHARKSLPLVAVTVSVFVLFAVCAPFSVAQGSASAGVVGMAVEAGETQAEVEAYWTPERLRSAQPMDLHPEVGADGLPIGTEVSTQFGRFVSERGAPPSVEIGNDSRKVLVPGGFALEAEPENDVMPFATSSFGAYFTTTRVFPDVTTTTYPYRTAGQLFYTDPTNGKHFVCSASVQRWRVLVTAGHCVAHGSTNPATRYFYGKFMFVPSENQGVAPNGVWVPSYIATTLQWLDDGSVPNQQDVGMLVIIDQTINGKGPFKIGQITGYLGYSHCTGLNCSNPPLAHNHVTMLGYPCNLDNCSRMEQNNAQTFGSGGSNTWIYGSAMRGGSSGGPWVQDFGVAPAGAPVGLLGNNFVIAVTSYGPVSTTPLYQGASAFDVRFANLLTLACSHAGSGGC